MAQPTDQQWLTRIRAGDTSAMGELLSAYQGRLFNVCLRMLSNRDDAAEVTQEAMLKIVQHIEGFRGKSQLSTWMIRIAMNQATTRLRQRKRRLMLSLDGQRNGHAHGDQADALRDTLRDEREPSPAAGVEKQEQLAQLQQALAKLEADFRAVLVLRDIEGLDYQQIADVVEAPVGTVKSRLFRARLALRQQLQAMEGDSADTRSQARPEVQDG
ncbi:RNA polymerase sigma factor [Phycisphaerales bacterium AB-hyl4]|uniref:RNA polymerase sigma factor n=1 Tax=Natronomicrosphaera hydrolytica TaxID=3242702 RepID=A0ABV4U311_9BACT